MKASIIRVVLVIIASVMAPLVGQDLAAQQPSTCYETWWPRGNRDIEIEICEYNQGSSGFTVLRNESDSRYDVCWTLEFDDETSARGCHSGLRPGAVARSSCSKCNRRGSSGGVVNVVFRKAERLGDEMQGAETSAGEEEHESHGSGGDAAPREP